MLWYLLRVRLRENGRSFAAHLEGLRLRVH